MLFLSAGNIIFNIKHEQDLRKFGGLLCIMPFTYISFYVGVLALIGFPFLSGFYSKDLIIEVCFSNYFFTSFFIYWISLISVVLTSFYSLRCFYLVFFRKISSERVIFQHFNYIKVGIFFSLLVLTLSSLFSGFFLKDWFVGKGSIFFSQSLYIFSCNKKGDYEFMLHWFKVIPFVGTFLGCFFSVSIYRIVKFFYVNNSYNSTLIIYCNQNFYNLLLKLFLYFRNFLHNKWFLDFIQNNYFAIYLLKHSYNTLYKVIDKGVLEIISINWFSLGFLFVNYKFSQKQNGYIYNMLCLLLLNIVFLISVFFIL